MAIYKFTETSVELEALEGYMGYRILKALENKPYRQMSPSDRKSVQSFFTDKVDFWKYGKTRHMGWMFDFSAHLKTYLVQYKYEPGVWHEMKSFNKTLIRDNPYHQYIARIIEMPEK